MTTRDKVLDDLARLAGGGMSLLSGLSQQMKSDMRARLDDLALQLDLVPREEFERVESLLRHTVQEVAQLRKTVAAMQSEKKTKTLKTKAQTPKVQKTRTKKK